MKFDVDSAIEDILVEGFTESDLLRAVLAVLPKTDIAEILALAEEHLFAQNEEEEDDSWDEDEEDIEGEDF